MRIGLIAFLFISFNLLAQIGGNATYQFLNLETNPSNAALGGKIVTEVNSDPLAGIYNPATINVDMDNHYSLSYVNYLSDINYGAAATTFQLQRSTRMIHVGVVYINYGSFDGYDLQGNTTGTFGAQEVAISGGYGMKIPNTNFHVGGNLKFISSQLENYNSYGLAIDLGAIYKNEKQKINVGLSIRNAGFQLVSYAGTSENLPLEVNLGISKTLENAPFKLFANFQNIQYWNLAFSNDNRATEDLLTGEVIEEDPGFFNNVFRHLTFGAEIFPEKTFNLRLGYNFRRAEELKILEQRSFAGLSGGFSLRIKKLRFTYSFARYNAVGSSNLFGLLLNLDEGKY